MNNLLAGIKLPTIDHHGSTVSSTSAEDCQLKGYVGSQELPVEMMSDMIEHVHY